MDYQSSSLVSEAFPYPEAPDIETSSEGYASRFSGEVGQWFTSVQTDALLSVIGEDTSQTVLDVGGGHAQSAIPLIEKGFHVTVLGSSAECARRLTSQIYANKCTFKVGPVLSLPFPDKSFDVVISFRLLSHLDQWEQLISEMCRVAKKIVILDYPPKQSFNALEPLLFDAKKKMEGNTRKYLSFSKSEIHNAFESRGFIHRRSIPQFFWPMVIHRKLQSPRLSSFLESVISPFGLRSILGSPIVASFEHLIV